MVSQRGIFVSCHLCPLTGDASFGTGELSLASTLGGLHGKALFPGGQAVDGRFVEPLSRGR
ncbi:hypothetical protein HMPREF1249_0614 [Jonquetella sp. BV3C21]|nr:hypothetical protein HMPREF1249_0614 [Jonquetella sp. BV3C21]